MQSPEFFKSLFLIPFVVSAAVSLVGTALVRWLYLRLSWLDDPSRSHHPKVVHSYPVPRGGGVAVFSAVAVSTLLFIGLDRHSLGILSGGLILTILGVLDDRIDLNPYFRLVANFLAAGLVVGSGIGISFITNPFGGVLHLDWPRITFFLFGEARTLLLIADLFALFWIVWSMNIVNWSKGVDGQLPGIVVVAATTIAFLSLRFTEDVTQWNVAIL